VEALIVHGGYRGGVDLTRAKTKLGRVIANVTAANVAPD